MSILHRQWKLNALIVKLPQCYLILIQVTNVQVPRYSIVTAVTRQVNQILIVLSNLASVLFLIVVCLIRQSQHLVSLVSRIPVAVNREVNGGQTTRTKQTTVIPSQIQIQVAIIVVRRIPRQNQMIKYLHYIHNVTVIWMTHLNDMMT